jgi:mannose-6-phosphate isomerase-like protein (cupin superfamily)
MFSKTSIEELSGVLTEPYKHLELGQVNDHAVYVVRFIGEFPFHRHTQDELYFVVDGEVKLEFTNLTPITLTKNESTVVRAYTTHKCYSEGAVVLLFKPKEMIASHADIY